MTTACLYNDCKEESRRSLAKPRELAAAKELYEIVIAGYTCQLGPLYLATALRRNGTTSVSSAVASSAASPSARPSDTKGSEIDSNHAQACISLGFIGGGISSGKTYREAECWQRPLEIDANDAQALLPHDARSH